DVPLTLVFEWESLERMIYLPDKLFILLKVRCKNRFFKKKIDFLLPSLLSPQRRRTPAKTHVTKNRLATHLKPAHHTGNAKNLFQKKVQCDSISPRLLGRNGCPQATDVREVEETGNLCSDEVSGLMYHLTQVLLSQSQETGTRDSNRSRSSKFEDFQVSSPAGLNDDQLFMDKICGSRPTLPSNKSQSGELSFVTSRETGFVIGRTTRQTHNETGTQTHNRYRSQTHNETETRSKKFDYEFTFEFDYQFKFLFQSLDLAKGAKMNYQLKNFEGSKRKIALKIFEWKNGEEVTATEITGAQITHNTSQILKKSAKQHAEHDSLKLNFLQEKTPSKKRKLCWRTWLCFSSYTKKKIKCVDLSRPCPVQPRGSQLQASFLCLSDATKYPALLE
ncbi:unnamed protein product, partial [Nesidiocoris tenuis]